MANKVLIKLRNKPQRPKRQILKLKTELWDGCRLEPALENLGNPNPADCYIWVDGYYDYSDTYLCFDREQTDEEYEQDLADYRKCLDKYNQWYKENEETILAEVARRKAESEEKQRKFINREKKRLQKELRTLDKRLLR